MAKKKGGKTKRLKEQFNKEIVGVIIITFGIISLLSSLNLEMGIIGSIIRNTIFTLMGFGGYFFPVAMIAVGIVFILDRFDKMENKKSIIILILFISFLILLDGKNDISETLIVRIKLTSTLSKFNKGGGVIGGFFGYFFYKLFGKIGGYIILSCITCISIIMLFEIKVKDLFKRIQIKRFKKGKKNERNDRKNKVLKHKDIPSIEKDISILDYTNLHNNVENKFTIDESKSSIVSVEKPEIESENVDYNIPPITMLKSPGNKQDGGDKKEVLNNARIIEETMQNFGIDATISQINKGPTITCYELSPAPGIKLSKIVSLSDNIALSLASSDIRIEAPIPGKAAVGIEVPNIIKDNVYLKEILLSDEYKNIDSTVPLALGKNVTGKPVISSIDKMPHLLIAGATGSGKSVCINTIIMSIIYKSSPADVKLLLIDPKVVELSIYNEIPHLLIPVVTDAKKASLALNGMVQEMERRYKMFAENSTRDIHSYNKKAVNHNLEKLSTIVIVIDELADLMMVAAQEVEDYICRLAQMARAAGIYLIVATQRPSVDVITGTIKANIPSRISFAVSSQVDSRTILDMSGAEKLLGKGDMLFYPSFYSKPERIQGAFISDAEVENVVNFLKENNVSSYNEDFIEDIDNKNELDFIDSDELLPDAIKLVVEEGQASISFLQRKLRIGYARAARIVDEMEQMNIIGGYEGSKPRKVLIDEEDLEDIKIL